MKHSEIQILIVFAGICSMLAGVAGLIFLTGGLPHPGRQSDFFFEILISQFFGSCCIVVVIVIATVISMAIAGRKRHNDKGS